MNFINDFLAWQEQQTKEIELFFKMLGDIVTSIPDFLSWIPMELYAIISVGVGVALVFQILGR